MNKQILVIAAVVLLALGLTTVTLVSAQSLKPAMASEDRSMSQILPAISQASVPDLLIPAGTTNPQLPMPNRPGSQPEVLPLSELRIHSAQSDSQYIPRPPEKQNDAPSGLVSRYFNNPAQERDDAHKLATVLEQHRPGKGASPDIDVYARANTTWDFVDGQFDPDVTVAFTVTDGSGNFKGGSSGTTNPDGWLDGLWCGDNSSTGDCDMLPGDQVTVTVDGSFLLFSCRSPSLDGSMSIRIRSPVRWKAAISPLMVNIGRTIRADREASVTFLRLTASVLSA